MSYKDKLVASKAAAFAFLREEIAERGIPVFILNDRDDLATSSPTIAGPDAIIPAIGDEREQRILGFAMDHAAQHSICIINGFTVAMKGKGLGGAMFKAALGVMHESGAQYLLLSEVIGDGPSFWSLYGAVPTKEPKQLAEMVDAEISDPQSRLTKEDKALFEAVGAVALSNSYLGWRLLSQANDLSVEGRQTRHQIFDKICNKGSLVLIPTEVGTKEILASRLGVLPNFCRPDQKLQPIEEALLEPVSLPAGIRLGAQQPASPAL